MFARSPRVSPIFQEPDTSSRNITPLSRSRRAAMSASSTPFSSAGSGEQHRNGNHVSRGAMQLDLTRIDDLEEHYQKTYQDGLDLRRDHTVLHSNVDRLAQKMNTSCSSLEGLIQSQFKAHGEARGAVDNRLESLGRALASDRELNGHRFDEISKEVETLVSACVSKRCDGLPRSTAALNQTINNAIEHKLKESIALLGGKLDETTAAMWEDIRSHIREAQHLQTENYTSPHEQYFQGEEGGLHPESDNCHTVSNLEKRITEQSITTQRLEERTTEQSNAIQRLEERATEQSNAIQQLEERTTEQSNAIQQLEERVTEQSNTIQQLEERTTEQSNAIQRLEERATEQSNTIKQLKEQLNTIQRPEKPNDAQPLVTTQIVKERSGQAPGLGPSVVAQGGTIRHREASLPITWPENIQRPWGVNSKRCLFFAMLASALFVAVKGIRRHRALESPSDLDALEGLNKLPTGSERTLGELREWLVDLGLEFGGQVYAASLT